MVVKSSVVFILFGFFHAVYPTIEGSSMETSDSSIESFRRVFKAFPCSDKDIVDRMFNDIYVIQNAFTFDQLESEEAEMDLLYIMIIGNHSNITIAKWYLIFEKTVGVFDKCISLNEERKKANDKILQAYLTPNQINRLNIFIRFIESNLSTPTMLRYLFGFSIGIALGLSESQITQLVEMHTSMDDFANELGKAVNDSCQIHFFPRNDRIAHDLIRVLLTNRFSIISGK